MATGALVCLLGLFVPKAASADVGEYQALYEESGVPIGGDLFSVTPGVSVNLFGGAAVVTAQDITVPSIGDLPFGFARTHSSSSRDRDGPLGLGWSGHYGYLRKNVTSQKVEFVDGSGRREIFYDHDVAALSHLKASSSSNISPSLSVVVRVDANTYHVFRPNGLRYTMEYQQGIYYAPTNIRDKSGNEWSISYKERPAGGYWWTHYPNHPVIDKLVELAGTNSRELEFIYNSDTPPRLTSIRINAASIAPTTLVTYEYETVGANKYLKRVRTPTGRTTTYNYNNTAPTHDDYQTIKSVAIPTGGTTELAYEERDYVYSPSGGVKILAVNTLKKIGDETHTWTFTYPSKAASAEFFTVTVSGPSYTSTRTFYSYTNQCGGTDRPWEVGRLVNLSETLDGYTRTAVFTWEGMLVSTEPLLTLCSWNNVYGTRLKETEVSGSDFDSGFSIIATVDAFHLLKPEDESTNTGLQIHRDMSDWVSNESMVIGLVESGTRRYNGTTLRRTTYSSFELGQPRTVTEYRNASSTLQHSLVYYTGSSGLGRRGMVKTKTTGSYSEAYDYRYGVLSSVDYPSGRPDVARTITPLGLLDEETTPGEAVDFDHDADGRLREADFELDDTKTIVYPDNNTTTVEQGSAWKQTIVDKWGRVTELRERINDTGTITATTTYTYDAYDREATVTNARDLTFTLIHDVNGELRSKTSSMESLEIDVHVSSEGKKTTYTKNASIVLAELRDFAGRYTETSVNGHKVTFSYSATSQGIKQTISPTSGLVRSVVFDWLGNRVEDDHPEMDSSVGYGLDARGWLSSVTQPGADSAITYYNHGGTRTIERGDETIDYSYDATYGRVSKVEYGPVIKEFRNRDLQGRMREIFLMVEGPPLPAPQTSLTCE